MHLFSNIHEYFLAPICAWVCWDVRAEPQCVPRVGTVLMELWSHGEPPLPNVTELCCWCCLRSLTPRGPVCTQHLPQVYDVVSTVLISGSYTSHQTSPHLRLKCSPAHVPQAPCTSFQTILHFVLMIIAWKAPLRSWPL